MNNINREDLIETLWNVKRGWRSVVEDVSDDLIETLWNVKTVKIAGKNLLNPI